MKKRASRATIVILFCWGLVAVVLLLLVWENRQVTLVGESEHWWAALTIPKPKDPLRDTVEGGRFTLTWTGSEKEYRQYQALEYRAKVYGGEESSGRISQTDGGTLPWQLTNKNVTIGWAFWHNPQVEVSVSRDGGPPEEFLLTIK